MSNTTGAVQLDGAPARELGGDQEHAAPVGADRRQDADGLGGSAQPLVARSAVRGRARADDAPHARAGRHAFQIDFDFIDHARGRRTSRGAVESFALVDGLSVAGFDEQLHAALAGSGVDVSIREEPYGLPMTTPFPEDREHAAYDRDAVERFWRILEWTDGVLEEFAGWYCGKSSPVHLFWHSFDLALTRFGGARAPALPERGPGHPRGVLARGGLVRLLGGRPERARAELLLLRRSRAGRPAAAAAAARAGALGGSGPRVDRVAPL